MPVPLAFHKIDNRFEWGLTRTTVGGFRRIVQLLKGIQYECPDEQFEISFDDGYDSVYTNALPILEITSFRAMVFIPTKYIGKTSSWDVYPGAGRFKHLNRQQIMELNKSGFLIGSHSHSHRNLTNLPESEMKRELTESKKILEDVCQSQVDSICYPYGRYNLKIIETALECGYKYGYTFFKKSGLYPPDSARQKMTGERIPIYLFDTPLSILLKLKGLGQFERFKSNIIKSYNSLSETSKVIR
ncbi:MAG: polysaccharide deacetylase family protein [candidate division Zixibacteria bacterium]|nr:polysaccharide deacetylase family protein [candidate division Zixibacteria bacterium]